MLSENVSLDFREAVFLTERAYFEGELDKLKFNNNIKLYSLICEKLTTTENFQYTEKDKEVAMTQCASFIFMTDTVRIAVGSDIVGSMPFSYNNEDFVGKKDWSNMFVSKLIGHLYYLVLQISNQNNHHR